MRKPIYTPLGAPPQGPYSQAMVAEGQLIFVSAQGPFLPETGELIDGTFREKAEQVFRNISVVLEAAGSSWTQVVKINVLLNSISDFGELNEVYADYVQEPYPARTTAQSNIGELAVFVDCIALVEPSQ